jgi:hypothetical protein
VVHKSLKIRNIAESICKCEWIHTLLVTGDYNVAEVKRKRCFKEEVFK